MPFSRRRWLVFSVFVLSSFGFAAAYAMAVGAALWFIQGAVWTFLLTSWAREHRERRRGWWVSTREHREGGAEVAVFTETPDGDKGITLLTVTPQGINLVASHDKPVKGP